MAARIFFYSIKKTITPYSSGWNKSSSSASDVSEDRFYKRVKGYIRIHKTHRNMIPAPRECYQHTFTHWLLADFAGFALKCYKYNFKWTQQYEFKLNEIRFWAGGLMNAELLCCLRAVSRSGTHLTYGKLQRWWTYRGMLCFCLNTHTLLLSLPHRWLIVSRSGWEHLLNVYDVMQKRNLQYVPKWLLINRISRVYKVCCQQNWKICIYNKFKVEVFFFFPPWAQICWK